MLLVAKSTLTDADESVHPYKGLGSSDFVRKSSRAGRIAISLGAL